MWLHHHWQQPAGTWHSEMGKNGQPGFIHQMDSEYALIQERKNMISEIKIFQEVFLSFFPFFSFSEFYME